MLAIWVKACNDQRPIMFYKSCKENFNFKNEEKVRELIKKNRELFRPLSAETLTEYQRYYTNHPEKFQAIFQNIEGEDVNEAIDRLTTNSAFTSQYRIKPDKPKSKNEILEFGIELIMKKWELEVKSKEERFRSWAYIIVPAIALVGSAVLSVFAVLYGK